jgi:hypothetical protein
VFLIVKTKTEKLKYQSVNEIPELTTLAEAKGLKLVQSFDCSSKKKSYILIPGAGEPGLLYTDDIKQLTKYLESYKSANTKLESEWQTSAEESEDTESSSEEGETTEEDDANFEE